MGRNSNIIAKFIWLTNIKRMNAFNRAVILIHVLLLFSADLYNYNNQVWESFPSQYYVFLNHICSLPFLLGLVVFNKRIIKLKYNNSLVKLKMVLLLNIAVFSPFILIYGYWGLSDFLSTGILILYISCYGFLLRFSLREIVLISCYFFALYFGLLFYFEIEYNTNSSLYLNGIASIYMYFVFSRLLYKSEYKSVETKFKIEEKNLALELLNKDLYRSQEKIKQQNEVLKEQNSSLTNFAQIVAHDIKAPLKMIQNFSDIISEKYKKELEEEDKPLLDYMSAGSHNLISIVGGLYDFTQISINDRVKDEKIDLNFTIKRSLALLSKELSANKIQVVYNQDFPIVKGVEELLQSVLLNLFGNAIKFRRNDGEAQLEISHGILKNNYAEICVRDNGIGIPEKSQKKVFQLFKKLHLSSEYEGLGIGLATCKKIIEKHGGKIWIESEKNNGTAVFFTLSLAAIEDVTKIENQEKMKSKV